MLKHLSDFIANLWIVIYYFQSYANNLAYTSQGNMIQFAIFDHHL